MPSEADDSNVSFIGITPRDSSVIFLILPEPIFNPFSVINLDIG